VKQLVRLPAAVAVVGVASFHGSGFIREAAVKELATVSDGSELPFLLLRLNDWVGVVRESSANAVQQRIRPEYASHFLRNLRLVFRLRSCGRGQDEEMIVQVTALLEDPSAFSILREGVFSHDRWLRRTALQMALAVKSEPGTALLQEILCHSDPIMRLWAARIVLERLGETELGPVLSALARDGFPPVRCEALTLYMRHFPNSASAKLNLALLDGSPAVRSLARYWVKTQNPEFNFADFYLKSLQAPSTRLVTSAILGLGETGKAADATGVLPFLEARLPGIRIAAIHSLAALDGDRLVARFVAALTSENPGVSNAVTRALLNRTNLIMDQLLLLFRGSLPSHVRKNIFRLMMNLPFWARGVYLFETLRDRDEHIVELGLRALKSWLEKSRNMATPPSHLELGELACGLKASAGMLSSHDLSEFEFLLRTYR
jgi:HEAT repeat protein